MFEDITLAAKLCIIKALPKSDMAIIWIDIWNSQSGSKAKLLINHSFSYGRFIATIRCNDKASCDDCLITLNVMRERRELDGVS